MSIAISILAGCAAATAILIWSETRTQKYVQNKDGVVYELVGRYVGDDGRMKYVLRSTQDLSIINVDGEGLSGKFHD